ncbi:MAG: hypothetical protein DMG25_08600 [Acidobacteria bacterium]|nr:MAG: hypothetical protein DMG25_08600 [Acidobacteriota bacterium]
MPAAKKPKLPPKPQLRFGIGEWYGKPFAALLTEDRQKLAEIQTLPKSEKPVITCPFQSTPERTVACKKPGGTCSFRLYQKSKQTGEVALVAGEAGQLRTFCPKRFEEGAMIYRWVGETVLNCAEPRVLKEIGFLEPPPPTEAQNEKSGESVGRIDKVLIVPEATPVSWCALEVQTVYFSGLSPVHTRRPDYRSSAPKRLMPQLQIKVPSLRRWGKKLAVVVDRSFFHAMGKMRTVPDISNCDVAWFVVKFEEAEGAYRLARDIVQYTTLEDSVEGLTAGVPVSLEVFEQRILKKLKRLLGPSKVAAD